MNLKDNEFYFQKLINGIDRGLAICELMINKFGEPSDYLILYANIEFANQYDLEVKAVSGRSIKEIDPNIQQSWIDIIDSAIKDYKSSQQFFLNHKTKRKYNVNIFPKGGNKFLIVTSDSNISELNNKEILKFMNFEKIDKSNLSVKGGVDFVLKDDEYENNIVELLLINKEISVKKDKLKIGIKELENLSFNIKRVREENKKLVLAIKLAKEKAERNKLAKTLFLTNMRQEVRAPMNGILGFSELLKKPKLNNENKQDYIRMVKKIGLDMIAELDFLNSLSRPVYLKFEEIIQKNKYKNIKVNDLAILCNMSLSSFKRKFTEIYADSPIKYLQKIKLIKASELLKDENIKISVVAYECGFHSLTAFNRSFKLYFGKTPSSYRFC